MLALGPRTRDVALQVVHALAQMLAAGCLPVFPSDGLDLYYYALTAHFGCWVKEAGQSKARGPVAADLLSAQVTKTYHHRTLSRVEARQRGGTLEQVKTRLQQLGFSGRINTAFIERGTLTLRRGVAALAWRTWSTVQSVGEMRLHLSWWRAYYHYVRPHTGLQSGSTSQSPLVMSVDPVREPPQSPHPSRGKAFSRRSLRIETAQLMGQ